MIVPNSLSITRSRDKEIEDVLDSDHYNNGIKIIEHELESYTDANAGTIVFNRTDIPRNITFRQYFSQLVF